MQCVIYFLNDYNCYAEKMTTKQWNGRIECSLSYGTGNIKWISKHCTLFDRLWSRCYAAGNELT